MEKISVQTSIQSDLQTVWEYWTHPNHIIHWNFASDEWCCPKATNNFIPNGRFNWRMEAKDGSMGFDFEGTYNKVMENELIAYSLLDGRKVEIVFTQEGDQVLVQETFDAEDINSLELQRAGWQAILNNFKNYVESNSISGDA